MFFGSYCSPIIKLQTQTTSYPVKTASATEIPINGLTGEKITRPSFNSNDGLVKCSKNLI
jgi:hypothetical protein